MFGLIILELYFCLCYFTFNKLTVWDSLVFTKPRDPKLRFNVECHNLLWDPLLSLTSNSFKGLQIVVTSVSKQLWYLFAILIFLSTLSKTPPIAVLPGLVGSVYYNLI